MSTPFAQLTERGRLRRLSRLARAALERYGLGAAEVTLLAADSNAVFLVRSAAARYVLRVGTPGQRTPLGVQSELAWLAALRRDTDLSVPEALPDRDGALVVAAEAPGVPEPRLCVLFRWMPGRALAERPTPARAERMGALLARLHQHADTFQPPAPFADTRLERAWTFGRPALLDSPAPDPLWSPERRRLVDQTAARVQALLDQLYADPRGLRFLHGDFHPGNLRHQRGALAVLDFDDSCWMAPAQDIGTALFYLLDEPDEAALRARFLEGYRRVRPGALPPPEQLDLCVAARQIDLLSYVLRHDVLTNEQLAGWLPRVEARLRRLVPG